MQIAQGNSILSSLTMSDLFRKVKAHILYSGAEANIPFCLWMPVYLCLWPKHARSHLISEAKQGQAWIVLEWDTAWEYRVFGYFPGGTRGREPSCQCRRHKRHGFDPWVKKIHWRRKWQPTPVFLPGEFPGQRSLVGYNPWGHKSICAAPSLLILCFHRP